jgi:hypothetical protein
VEEVLIYDDASDTPPEPYLIAGLPTRVLRGRTNVGPAVARNLLFHESQSALVHFHDADDAFAPTWREEVGRLLDDGSRDAVFTEVGWVEESGERRDSTVGLEQLGAGADLLAFAIRNSILTPTGTYQRALVLSIGGYRPGLWQAEDWDFHVRLASRSPRYEILLRPLVVVHARREGRSNDRLDVWRSQLKAIDLLSSELPAAYRQDLCEVATRVGSMLYQAGHHNQAQEAFALAARLGQSSFAGRPGLYRTVARRAGAVHAERLAAIWRGFLPSTIRQLLSSRRA